MRNKNIQRIIFSSGISDITERNKSFDGGVLKVAYTGKNRNGSFISKAAFERSMSSIYNCPIVANYDRETDSIGSHDMEVIRDEAGVRVVNITQPVGLVPESARVWWSVEADENGVEHEYLCTDILLWKRQEAYAKIKRDGITDESMEIDVIAGNYSKADDIYYIEKFEFTAFCLLGSAEPCFEGASIEVFSHDDIRAQFSEMLSEFKESFSVISAPGGHEDINIITEGGKKALQDNSNLDKREVFADGEGEAPGTADTEAATGNDPDNTQNGTDSGNGDGNNTDPATESGGDVPGGDVPGGDVPGGNEPGGDVPGGDEPGGDEPAVDDDNSDEDPVTPGRARPAIYELISLVIEEAVKALHALGEVQMPWGTDYRYQYWDIDVDAGEVYATDMLDWNIYGFTYVLNGDALSVNEESKRRMKIELMPFNGEESDGIHNLFTHFNKQYKSLKDSVAEAGEELRNLREYKMSIEHEILAAEQERVFEMFSDLSGIDAYESLRSEPGDISAEALEEKCYAIKGRYSASLNYSKDSKAPKLPVLGTGKPVAKADRYNGAFEEYGYKPIN